MSSIRVEKAHFLYENRAISGLHDINLEFKNQDIVSIVGPSGSGKTTLIKAIAGEITLQSGSINKEALNIELLSQTYSFDPDENILEALIKRVAVSREIAIEKIRYWIELLELTNEIEKDFKALSEGQKQRVHIISALIQDPDFLLLDEPFGHLDPNIRNEIIGSIFPILKERKVGIIWVTHDLKNAFGHSSKMIVLNFGEVLQYDLPINIYEKPTCLFVAQFTGECNIILGNINENKVETDFGIITNALISGKTPTFLLRPEKILIADNSQIKARKVKSIFQGDSYLNQVELESQKKLWLKSDSPIADKVYLNADVSSFWQLPSL